MPPCWRRFRIGRMHYASESCLKERINLVTWIEQALKTLHSSSSLWITRFFCFSLGSSRCDCHFRTNETSTSSLSRDPREVHQRAKRINFLTNLKRNYRIIIQDTGTYFTITCQVLINLVFSSRKTTKVETETQLRTIDANTRRIMWFKFVVF